ncbi:MAG: preprotein translocase subunit SecD, partial [Microbacteriaceae bacterium]|nr:preprotein translocase subunit SecD [Microbacteriaceae bacterium]
MHPEKAEYPLARTSPVKKAWRSITWLVVIVAFLAIVVGAGALGDPVKSNNHWAPKLGLDLSGGTEIILAPKVASGQAAPTADQLNQAVSIIRQRVDASGATEAQVNTQGGQNIVVSIPGSPDQATL